MDDLVSVIITNKERQFFLERCLTSLMTQTYTNLEIILVDNGSRKATIDIVEKFYPKIKIIKNATNEFYCLASNQGIKVSQGKYVLCLNNDITLSPNFIAEVVNCFSIDSSIGMVSGKIFSEDKTHIDSAGLKLSRSRKPIDIGYKKKEGGIFWKSGYTFGACGSAALFKKEMLEMIKIEDEYFDEDFKIYYEDLDIAWRAHQFKWKAYYTSSAIGIHYRGGTSKTEIPLKIFKNYDFPYLSFDCKKHLIKNRYLTMLKNDTVFSFLVNFPFILFYDLKLWLYLLLFERDLVCCFFKKRNLAKMYINNAWRKRKIINKKVNELIC